MSYIGPEPYEAFTSYATETFSVSATTSYTLSHSVANENELALFINNVRQQPGSGKAYTASGTTLTLSAATATTDTMYAIYLGRALQTSVPHTNSVTSSMLGSNFFTGATDIGGAIADADLFLVDDGAGGTLRKTAASRIKTYVGSNSSLFFATLSANQSVSANTWTKVTLDQEIFDPDGVFGSNKFTVPSTGYYALFGGARIDSPNGGENCSINFYKNGSFWTGTTEDRRFANTDGHELFLRISAIQYLTATDYFELYVRSNANTENVNGTSAGTPTGIEAYTFMSGFKLIT